MTVTWDVDDSKVSHEESAEATTFIMATSGICRNCLAVTRFKAYLYLCMNFDYTNIGDITISMISYVKQIQATSPSQLPIRKNTCRVTPIPGTVRE